MKGAGCKGKEVIAAIKNLVLDKGATFKQVFRYKDSSGEPMDLSDHTAVFRVVNAFSGETIKAVDGDLSLINDEVGYITIVISDEETALFKRGKEAYALEIEDSEGAITRLLMGSLEIRTVAGD